MPYKFLPHTADIKFRATGKTLNNAFENAALAVSHYLSHGEKIPAKITKEIKLQGHDKENLLYNFLEELIFLLDNKNFITAKAKIKLKDNSLTAVLYGDKASNYKSIKEIKAPTYAEMYIKKTKLGWQVQAVMDV